MASNSEDRFSRIYGKLVKVDKAKNKPAHEAKMLLLLVVSVKHSENNLT